MGNYVGKIWRGMCKVSISTIPVSRREGGGGGGDLEGGGGRGRGRGGGRGKEGEVLCKVCSRDTTTRV